MIAADNTILRLAVACGVGLLIGIERERSNSSSDTASAAGVRTFTLTGLIGAISALLGSELVVIAFALIIGGLVMLSYRRTRERDPGLTTELAQVSVFLLGALAMRDPQLAAGLGVVIAILLLSRTSLHHWVRNVLTDAEIHDGLLLAAAALIILPLTPDRTIDPWNVINPRTLWALAITVMSINALGYIALRLAGPKVGLAVAGLFSGFVSSTATLAAMATRARNQPELRQGAVAGAAIASVASLIELAVLIGVVNLELLRHLAWPLIAAGLVSLLYAVVFAIRSAREAGESQPPAGRPFDPKAAALFVLVIGLSLAASALLTQWLGNRGLVLASAVSGLGDIHASAISSASLSRSGAVAVTVATYAVLAGFSANAVSKLIVAFSLGQRPFGLTIAPGIVLPVAVAWLTLLARGMIL
jgi:uncharacterized membrane protein (DUF4010 family)